MKVKICGVCRPEDAAAAAEAGADYVGVIVGAASRRLRSTAEARAIFEAAGAPRRVGVFADAPADEVERSVHDLRLDVVQLHGAETPAEVLVIRESGVRVWKAVRPRTAAELTEALSIYAAVADGLLVDGWSAAGAGGVGARAPWPALASVRARIPAELQFVLAGGLTADTVAKAIGVLAPDVVDVSSGVEAAPGEKSADLIRAFIAAARTPQSVAGARA